MMLLLAVKINDSQLQKIGWALGNYSDDPPDENECKDWLEAHLQDTFNELPLPPE